MPPYYANARPAEGLDLGKDASVRGATEREPATRAGPFGLHSLASQSGPALGGCA